MLDAALDPDKHQADFLAFVQRWLNTSAEILVKQSAYVLLSSDLLALYANGKNNVTSDGCFLLQNGIPACKSGNKRPISASPIRPLSPAAAMTTKLFGFKL
ncbi:MAG: hypothetical protein ACO1RX_10670 [Candidatus Sericytochromatia bacterium]